MFFINFLSALFIIGFMLSSVGCMFFFVYFLAAAADGGRAPRNERIKNFFYALGMVLIGCLIIATCKTYGPPDVWVKILFPDR